MTRRTSVWAWKHFWKCSWVPLVDDEELTVVILGEQVVQAALQPH
jgi:hypothetical protein